MIEFPFNQEEFFFNYKSRAILNDYSRLSSFSYDTISGDYQSKKSREITTSILPSDLNAVFLSQNVLVYENDKMCVIPILGDLLNSDYDIVSSCNERGEFFTSYKGIVSALSYASGENKETIIFYINSLGGHAQGMLSCVKKCDDILKNCSSQTIALVRDGYSAAYALSCVCSSIWCSKLSGVGSIGTVFVIPDYSESNKMKGYKSEIIQSGKHKSPIDEYNKLTKEHRDFIQKQVNLMAKDFCSFVSQKRGGTTDYYLSLEGSPYLALDGVSLGLVDKIFKEDIFYQAQSFYPLLNHSSYYEFIGVEKKIINKEGVSSMDNKEMMSLMQTVGEMRAKIEMLSEKISLLENKLVDESYINDQFVSKQDLQQVNDYLMRLSSTIEEKKNMQKDFQEESEKICCTINEGNIKYTNPLFRV